MQTFLPYAHFQRSAEVLDKKRAWKQVVEAHQLLNTLGGKSEGWKNHPACKMWKGYETGLIHYYNVFWSHCVDNLGIKAVKMRFNTQCAHDPIKIPPWVGYEPFHAAHRSNLLRKSDHYKQFGWLEDDSLPYIWPVDKNNNLLPEIQTWVEPIQSKHSLQTA